jgi:hypothetical protein
MSGPCLLGTSTNSRPLQEYSKQNLPEGTRVIESGMPVTRDFRPDRRVLASLSRSSADAPHAQAECDAGRV